MSNISRRNLLKGSVAAAGASALSFSQLFGVLAQDGGDDPQTILNLAATAEAFACTHYYNALTSGGLNLSERETIWLKSFLDSELVHLQFLEANGATRLANEFYVPENLFTDRALFVATSDTAENWFIGAYLAATRRFAELGEPLLAATASQVSGVESQHQALIRLMGGLIPSNTTLKRPLFWNTSEVAPLFQPFLEGAEGFVGPAPFPGVDEINALTGDIKVQLVTPFISLSAGTGTLSTMEGTNEAGSEMNMNSTTGMSEENMPADTGSDSSSGDDSTGDDTTGDDSTGEDTTGEDTTGEDTTGEDTTGEDTTGDDSTVGDVVDEIIPTLVP